MTSYKSSPEWLALYSGGCDFPMAERATFAALRPEAKSAYRKAHPNHQDARFANSNMLLIVDGITRSGMTPDSGGDAARLAIEELPSYLADEGIHEQEPEGALQTLRDSAAHVDNKLAQLVGRGGIALTVVTRTANPTVWAGLSSGDARVHHNRAGIPLFSSLAQNIMQKGQPYLANSLGGHGRPSAKQAVNEAKRTGYNPVYFMDQTWLMHVQPGDEFVLHTDGRKAEPKTIAQLTAQYGTPAEAALALALSEQQVVDDVAVIVGRLALPGQW